MQCGYDAALKLAPTLYTSMRGLVSRIHKQLRVNRHCQVNVGWLSGSDGNHFNPYPAGNEREEGKVAVKKIHGEGTSGKGNETASW